MSSTCVSRRNSLRVYYELPIVDSISSKLADAKNFFILDTNAGFWIILLDAECKICTPFGCYMFKRLPYGVQKSF